MAEQEAKLDTKPDVQEKPVGLNIKLVPVAQSDQPVLSNIFTVNVSPGIAFIDFGFLEPSLLAAIPRIARAGGKMPESISGVLAVRVALGFDVLQNLHQQLGRVIASLSAAPAGGKK